MPKPKSDPKESTFTDRSIRWPRHTGYYERIWKFHKAIVILNSMDDNFKDLKNRDLYVQEVLFVFHS